MYEDFEIKNRETIKSGTSSSDNEIKIEEIYSMTNDEGKQTFNPLNKQESSTSLQSEFELSTVKTGEDIRRSYIAKLIYKKIWQPTKKEKDHNTLIIFDWDDTLLCTSFLTPNGVFFRRD